MKLSIVGSRGIPARYGGFETFAEEISVLLAARGIEVSVQCDRGSYNEDEYRGVNLFFSTIPKTKSRLRYYFEGIRWAVRNADVIMVLGSGGAVFYLLNIRKRRVILTNTDGLEFKRAKWSFPVKMYWRLSEAISVLLSDFLIADSMEIGKYLRKKYSFSSEKVRVIEYGAYENITPDLKPIEKHLLERQGYYLMVCRLEPENNLEVVIEGYIRSGSVKPLVIAGNTLENRHARYLFNKYNSERIRFLGGIYDKYELSALRFSCLAYIHGHSVGGTNPSLLEAMGSSNIILAHDNIFNREVTDSRQIYFRNSDDCALGIQLIERMSESERETFRKAALERILNYYSWEKMLQKYVKLLDSIAFNDIKV